LIPPEVALAELERTMSNYQKKAFYGITGAIFATLVIALAGCDGSSHEQREAGSAITGDWAWVVRGNGNCDSVNLVRVKISEDKIEAIDNRNFKIKYSDIDKIDYKNNVVHITHSIYKYSSINFDDGEKQNSVEQYFVDEGSILKSAGFIIEGARVENSEINAEPMLLKKCY
jgi:hypothetical protein